MASQDQQSRELVLLVGMPGCGKTAYCSSHLAGHRRVSQDEGPRTFDGVLRLVSQLLELGEPLVVIDRTNPARPQREAFASAARAHGYRVRIIHFDIPRQVCEQRITRRTQHPTLQADKMNEAINAFLSRLDVPAPDECDELTIVNS
jgi:predicted kinase